MTQRQLPRYSIRLANTADQPAVSECARRAYEKYIAAIGMPPGPMLADYGESIASGHLHVLVVAGQVSGFVACYARSDQWLLENVALLPAYQGKGLGRVLVDFAEDAGRKAGFSVIVLYTHQKMTANIRYYESIGYRETGKRSEHGYDRVYMEKPLV